MFVVTEELIQAVVSINHEAPDTWKRILDYLKNLRDEQLSEFLHHMPPRYDVNFQYRHDTTQGILICLDVLCGLFSDPASALEHLEIVNESLKSDSSI